MKRLNLLFILLTSILLLQSCDFLKKKDKNGNPIADAPKGKDADDIITFYNKAVQLDDRQAKYIKSFDEYMEKVEAFVEAKLNSSQGTFAIKPFYTGLYTLSSVEVKNIKAPSVLGSEYQTMISEMINSFEPLLTYKTEIGKYLDAEDYKDDKGAKAKQIKENVEKAIIANKKASETFFAKIAPQVDKAEEDILADHPLKKQIIQSKSLLALVKQTSEITAKETDPNVLKTKFTELYNQIQAGLDKNKSSSFPTDSKLKTRKNAFDRFNSRVDDHLGKMRVAQRALNEGKSLSEFEYSDLDRSVGYVLDAYNSFVD